MLNFLKHTVTVSIEGTNQSQVLTTSNTMLNPAQSGKFIADNSAHIKILKEGVDKAVDVIIKRIESGDISTDKIFTKTEIHPQSADVNGVNWIFFADLFNFSFWKKDSEPQYTVTYKCKKYTGYLALCAAINRTLDKGIQLTNPEFFGSRHSLLKSASDKLLSKYNGSFMNCITRCNKSVISLLELIVRDFPAFDDKALFHGKKGIGEFSDIDQITMFPDYRVPQSLQYLGVFEYSKELMHVLKLDELLPNGSEMEVEIRGCSIDAVEQIKNALRLSPRYDESKHGFVNSALIDYFLWGLRREHAEEMKVYPYHKTRTHPGALGGACEPIKIEACQLWGYNETSMPNLANHVKQADAKVEFDTFAPLMDSGCSNELPFFSFVRSTLQCVLHCFPRRWLLDLAGLCVRNLFHPENKEHEMCMKGPGESATLPRLSISTLHTFRTNHLFRERVKQHLSSDSELNHKYKDYVKLLETDLNMRNPATTTHSECRHLKRSTQYRRVERLGTCIPLCDQDIFFDGYQKNFAVIWMTVWSSLCLGSTLFTLVTYCLDPEQFKFPEKSVIFITFCYSLHALGYVFRLLGGRDAIACQSSDEDPNISLLTQEGLRNEYCVVNALLLFYPFHAASTWWTIGTFTWLLSRFDLLPYSLLHHWYGKKIDASELTGMCSIGNQNEDNLLFFIIIPEALQFGVFWILYTLPKACVIGCISYEYLNRGAWLDVTKINRPNVEIFMLHICMSLVIGITTCYWIWSEQTFNNWKNIGRSCLGFWKRDKQPPTPTFPTVRYRPQPGDGCSAVATTTKLPVYPTCSIGGSIQIGHQPSIRSSPVVL
ncbi:unnamed protein product [Lepeophtheirus salmonis]|uniref:Queuosine 5'-phosphate N-glycosylase/hydrolase n=1 Tax=Lepeophtheirus salmonis TaxID=72036 RepID=A0A7R8CI75_LEPSM|nr:unnamed protein product [Lepeophtheirus salmonis]CAF2829753.1 unnamed protein product [Lepeophtheirus salmonis]